jgi:exopolyphosphatase/guanosine-5'-triphosphate,3'-diphosphate pyrophosphatase
MYIRSSTQDAGAVAAIDIGSNSIHLVVARIDKSGGLDVLDSEKMGVRLGAYLEADGTLSREGQIKAIQSIGHMAEIARAYKATIRAVATHTLREATNHTDLIKEIRQKTGVKVDLIDGVEEARLVFLGMRYALPLERQTCLGMDIGGGSTEFIVARGDQIHFATSLKIGAVALTVNQLGMGSTSNSKIKEVHQYINLRIKPLVGQVKKHSFTKAIASSGTAKALAVAHARLFKGRALTDENGYDLPSSELEVIVKAVEALRFSKRIKEALGIDASRAEIILAGAAIMLEASRAFGVKNWTITTYGLKEGVAIDCFRRMGEDRLGNVKDIRWESVIDLGSRWGIDEIYAAQVTKLSQEIFDKLVPLLYPGQARESWMGDRDILRVASWLHEAGRFISTSSYHKHSHYLIYNFRLLGFTQDERQMISLVVLYHRKSSPKISAPEVEDLQKEEFERLVFLSGILRMASALNRTRRGIISGVRIQKIRGLVFKFICRSGADPSVEMLQLSREVDHFEKAFEKKFEVNVEKKQMHSVRGKPKKIKSKKKALKKGKKKANKKATLRKVSKIRAKKGTTKKLRLVMMRTSKKASK